jgi:putative Ca2+/H+ antiporter (TMEM165/GDT1 family)
MAQEEKPGFLKSCLCLVLPAIVVEAFLMTFLAEWGDRSQLATIG